MDGRFLSRNAIRSFPFLSSPSSCQSVEGPSWSQLPWCPIFCSRKEPSRPGERESWLVTLVVVGPVTFTLWLVEILTTGTCDLVMTEQGCKHQQSTQSISQVGLKGKSKTNTLRTFHFRNGSQSFRWNHLTQLHKTRLPTKTKTGTLCFRHLSQYEVWQVLKSMIYLSLVTQM